MVNKYILSLSLLSLLSFTAASANQNGQIINQPIPQNRNPNKNNNSIGNVTRIMNRMPRRLDKQSIINSAPGILQETLYWFGRFGRGQTNKGIPVPPQQNTPQPQSPQVNQPTAPTIPQSISPEPLAEIENQAEQINKDFKDVRLPQMIPAPKPGYIIRFNEEKGVYEEVREIPIAPIPAVEN